MGKNQDIKGGFLHGFKFTIYIAMYVVLIGLTGVLNVVVFKEFDWQSLMNIEFWIPIAVNNTFYFSAFLITVLLVFDVLALKDTKYVDLEDDIYSERDVILSDEFKQHVVNRNFFEKKNVWFQFVNTWIGNLQSKLKHKVSVDLATQKNKDLWKRATKRYIKKRETLNNFKTKAWVEQNLMFRKRLGWGKLGFLKHLDYPEITVNEILYGSTQFKPRKSELNRHVLRGQILQKSIGTALSIILSVVSNLLQVDRWLSTFSLIIALAIMLFSILMNVAVGVFAGFKSHKERVENASKRYGYVFDYTVNKKRYPQAPVIDYVVVEDKKDDIKDTSHNQLNIKEKEPILA